MKRILLLFMFMGLSLYSFSSPNVQKITIQHVVEIGKSIVIDPLADIKYNRSQLYYMSGMLNTSNSEAYTTTNFSFSTETYIGSYTVNGSTGRCDGFVYTITPQKVSTSSFSIKVVAVIPPIDYSHFEITYTIIAIDITNISIPKDLSLTVGESYTFEPVITDSRAEAKLTWASSNSSIVSITQDGKATARNVGTAKITCTAKNGISAECNITVNPIYIESIRVSPTEWAMSVGENKQLTAYTEPQNASVSSVQWSSSDLKVAVVDQNGLVTAVGSGIAQITVAAKDGSGKSASCVITVEKDNKITISDVAQCNGGRGEMAVQLTDEETIIGFQFDLTLPVGISVPVNDNGELMTTLTGNAERTHSISSAKRTDGSYRFLVSSTTGLPISNANGDGMSITFDVAESMAEGTYTIGISNIEMTVKRAGGIYEDLHPKNSQAKLTVVKAIPGDVNGDGRISVTDLSSIIGYIQGDKPSSFIQKAADMNNDGKISITDAVRVIYAILNN